MVTPDGLQQFLFHSERQVVVVDHVVGIPEDHNRCQRGER